MYIQPVICIKGSLTLHSCYFMQSQPHSCQYAHLKNRTMRMKSQIKSLQNLILPPSNVKNEKVKKGSYLQDHFRYRNKLVLEQNLSLQWLWCKQWLLHWECLTVHLHKDHRKMTNKIESKFCSFLSYFLETWLIITVTQQKPKHVCISVYVLTCVYVCVCVCVS